MHYKTKSTIAISLFVFIMLAIAVTLSTVRQPQITGAASGCDVACRSHADCYDGNACTVEQCVNPFECNAECVVSEITSAIDGDGCCPAGADADSDC